MGSLACLAPEAGTQAHTLAERLILLWIPTEAVPLQARQSLQALLCFSLVTVSRPHAVPFNTASGYSQLSLFLSYDWALTLCLF